MCNSQCVLAVCSSFSCYAVDAYIMKTHDASQSQLCKNMKSSTKPEEHNISQRHQRKIEPLPKSTCTKNLVKFDRVVFEICE